MMMRWAGAEVGWILETDKPISQEEMIKVWDYTMRDQIRQIANMSAGPKREVYEGALIDLKAMKITHSIKPQGGAN